MADPDFWEVTWQTEGTEFEALVKLAIPETYPNQHIIFKQGDPADSMYLVQKGYALAVANDPETGEERNTGIVAAGQSFGELGLLMNQPRTATVVAGTDLTVLRVTLETLRALEEAEPAIAARLYKSLARTLAVQLVAGESTKNN